MQYLNVIYDYDYDDELDVITVKGNVDIIAVPDIVFNNMDAIVQEFFNWASLDESGCWNIIDGKRVCCTSIDDFIKWLNIHYDDDERCKSKVVARNVTHNPLFQNVEF